MKELRILILEDEAADVELIRQELKNKGLGFHSLHVKTQEGYVRELRARPPDLILADHVLPSFDGFAALRWRERLCPEVPFIFVTGSMGEQMAIETFQRGATDYVLKSRLATLVPAIRRSLREQRERARRRLAEEKLRQNELRFRALIEHSMDAVALLDARGIILYASASTSRILGYAKERMPGRNAFQYVHPEDRLRTWDIFQRCAEGPENHVRFECRYRHANETWVWLEIVGTNLFAQPSVRAFVANFRDVSKRKESEQRFHALAEQQMAIAEFGSLALVGIDPAVLMEDAVEVARRHLDMEFAGIYERLPDGRALRLRAGAGWPADLIGEAAVPAEACSPIGGSLAANAPVIVEDMEQRPELGWPEWMRLHDPASSASVPIKGREHPYGVLGVQGSLPRSIPRSDIQFLESLAYLVAVALERWRIQKEITELNHKLEERVHQRTAELKLAYEEMEAFSYTVSHDLRSPLRRIHGFANLLLEECAGDSNAAPAQHLRTIAESAAQMDQLIKDLLEFSRMSTAEIRKVPVRLPDLVRSVILSFQEELQGRAVRWEIEPLPIVQADPGLLRLVFVNLLSNALKYTRLRAEAVIRVGSSSSSDERVIFIHDNGVGFDMEYSSKLFGVFKRLHSKEQFEGTGIGLANVRRIIERHGGRTWAEGKTGAGATFYFALPREKELA